MIPLLQCFCAASYNGRLTTFLLIRHGLTDAVGHRLTGRLPGVHLSEIGRGQALRLPDRLARWKIDAVYSSPMERTMETAAPTAQHLQLPLVADIRLAEFDYGDWSGMTIGQLEPRDDWKRFVRLRSGTRAPKGESIFDVQARMMTALMELAEKHTGQTVAVFSHADAIRAVIMVVLGIPADHIQRIDIVPASISVVRFQDTFPLLLGVNLAP